MPNVVKEIVRDYDIDAVFANRWQGHGVCYCASCTERFRAATGHELPKVADANDPVWQAWTRWRRDVLTRMIVAWDEDVKAIRPHASFIPNMSGASLMEFDLKLIEKHCPFIVVDDQGRRGTESLWMAGRNGKRVRATFRERPVILITSIGPEEEHRWKDAVTTGPEMAGWITNGTAHGMLPWFTKFNGVVPDTRWVAAGRRRLRHCTPTSSRCSARWRRPPRSRSSTRARRCATGRRRCAARPSPTTSASTRRWSRRSCPSSSSPTR